jgi:hypothetical protein
MLKTVVITPSTCDLPPGWSIDRFREALQRAADAWSFPNVPCATKLVVGEPQAEWRATRDGKNLVAFRGKSWCHNERCGPSSTFPLRAMAMTSTYPSETSRPPEEADVELNAVSFQLTPGAGGSSPASPQWSVPLEPVLVHEIGHVLGLPDVCGAHRRASGRPVITACPAEDRQRVMFAANLNTRPTPADVAELCRLYPTVDTATTAHESTTTAPTGHDWGGGAWAGAQLLLSLGIVALAVGMGRRVRRSYESLRLSRLGRRAR